MIQGEHHRCSFADLRLTYKKIKSLYHIWNGDLDMATVTSSSDYDHRYVPEKMWDQRWDHNILYVWHPKANDGAPKVTVALNVSLSF